MHFQQQKKDYNEEQNPSIKYIAVLPGVLLIFIKFSQFGFAYYNSQEKRINRILKNFNKNVANELGFMNKIKEEVNIFGLELHFFCQLKIFKKS